MKIHDVVIELKKEINEKSELLEQRRLIMESIQNGEDFFLKESSSSTTADRLAQGASLMVGYIKQLREIDARIFAIDTMIIVRLEADLSDSISKFVLPEKVNEAGDIISKQHAYFVPDYNNPHFIEIVPDDIWYLKILKQAVGASNIEIIPKSEYYK